MGHIVGLIVVLMVDDKKILAVSVIIHEPPHDKTNKMTVRPG